MSVRILQDRLDGYECSSTLEEEQALREITQEIALAALGRTDFFQFAAFQGGTCLRIFHGLDRFSEDLDFALQKPVSKFDLSNYFKPLQKELTAYGYDLEIDHRQRPDQAVHVAFLKDSAVSSHLQLGHQNPTGPARKLRIKLEVDTNPPAGATYDTRYLDFPFPSALRLFDLPSLFAGKIHALLCREYIKGRDWYDFNWYTTRKIQPKYSLLKAALFQFGPWQGQQVEVNTNWCRNQLAQKIGTVDWNRAKADVKRFLRPGALRTLDLWGGEFFLHQADKVG